MFPGLSETLDEEISPLGLRSICFEFGYFRTQFLSPDHRGQDKEGIADYAETAHKSIETLAGEDCRLPGFKFELT